MSHVSVTAVTEKRLGRFIGDTKSVSPLGKNEPQNVPVRVITPVQG
jgi:hypothetical protein